MEVNLNSGGIRHLIDKASGYDLVPEGEMMGVLEIHHEIPHGMSAWEIGQVPRITQLTEDGFRLSAELGVNFRFWKTIPRTGSPLRITSRQGRTARQSRSGITWARLGFWWRFRSAPAARCWSSGC